MYQARSAYGKSTHSYSVVLAMVRYSNTPVVIAHASLLRHEMTRPHDCCFLASIAQEIWPSFESDLLSLFSAPQ